jgi:hypothetical protein
MHSSYNYSGFVDLYTSLSRRAASKSRAADAKPGAPSATPERHSPPAQPAGASYRQRLKLVPR